MVCTRAQSFALRFRCVRRDMPVWRIGKFGGNLGAATRDVVAFNQRVFSKFRAKSLRTKQTFLRKFALKSADSGVSNTRELSMLMQEKRPMIAQLDV